MFCSRWFHDSDWWLCYAVDGYMTADWWLCSVLDGFMTADWWLCSVLDGFMTVIGGCVLSWMVT